MKKLWLLLVIPLFGFTRIHPTYDRPADIQDEFANVQNDLQPKEFTVFQSTPNLGDLRDGELVIVSSGAYVKMMFRQNQEIYKIDVSCVTVYR